MFKFATSTLLAASAMAVQLQSSDLYMCTDDDPTCGGTSILDRMKLIHNVVDQNDDMVLTISELAKMLFLIEWWGYISHEEAKDIAYDFMHLHLLFGDEITILEITAAMLSFELPEDADKKEMILEAVYLIEWMILDHGMLMEFFKADSNDRGYISKAEADAAGWSADFDEYD